MTGLGGDANTISSSGQKEWFGTTVLSSSNKGGLDGKCSSSVGPERGSGKLESGGRLGNSSSGGASMGVVPGGEIGRHSFSKGGDSLATGVNAGESTDSEEPTGLDWPTRGDEQKSVLSKPSNSEPDDESASIIDCGD